MIVRQRITLWWMHAIYAVAQHFTAGTVAICLGFRLIRRRISLWTDIALPHFPLLRCFVTDDQTVAVVMSTTHDMACKICRSGAQPPSCLARFVLACRHHNKGGTNRGPFLETECARCVRRVRFRWRDLAGSILTSRGRRRRHTDKYAGAMTTCLLYTSPSP